MFFSLSHLSLADVWSSSSIAPMMLCDTFLRGKSSPLWVVLTDVFLVRFLLEAMVHDWYTAICNLPCTQSSCPSRPVCSWWRDLVPQAFQMPLLQRPSLFAHPSAVQMWSTTFSVTFCLVSPRHVPTPGTIGWLFSSWLELLWCASVPN